MSFTLCPKSVLVTEFGGIGSPEIIVLFMFNAPSKAESKPALVNFCSLKYQCWAIEACLAHQ